MIKVLIQRLGNDVRTTMSGVATVQQVGEIVGKLQTIKLQAGAALILDLAGITELDMSFLQVLVSLGLTINQKGSRLAVRLLPETHPVLMYARGTGLNIEHFASLVEVEA
jgi:hypothetical protein